MTDTNAALVFAGKVLEEMRDCSMEVQVDVLQDMAVKCGLMTSEHRPRSCGESCACDEEEGPEDERICMTLTDAGREAWQAAIKSDVPSEGRG